MPHSLSAKKRIRQNAKRQERNRTIKSRIRTARRAFLKAVEAADLPAARSQRARPPSMASHQKAGGADVGSVGMASHRKHNY